MIPVGKFKDETPVPQKEGEKKKEEPKKPEVKKEKDSEIVKNFKIYG